MGLYDRDYYRTEEPGYHVSIAAWTCTVKIILATLAVYVVQVLTKNAGGWFNDTFSLHDDWWQTPWLAFELLTYGFLHSVDDMWHIVGNMFLLWLLGRELEAKYGRQEFLVFYLCAIVFAGVGWSIAQTLQPDPARVMGASGGVAGVLVLFAFNFPRREVLFLFTIPLPVWLFAVIVLAFDIHGSIVRPERIGYEAHLAGALFGFGYYQLGWRLARWLPDRLALPSLKRRPKLRVHRPEEIPENALESQVDEILRKIQEKGQDSLTRKERQILEKASQEYKRRRS
jgi:membrane associated rhomboid family serine protease